MRTKGAKNKKKVSIVKNEEKPKVEKIDKGLMTLARKKVITVADLVDDDEIDVYF